MLMGLRVWHNFVASPAAATLMKAVMMGFVLSLRVYQFRRESETASTHLYYTSITFVARIL